MSAWLNLARGSALTASSHYKDQIKHISVLLFTAHDEKDDDFTRVPRSSLTRWIFVGQDLTSYFPSRLSKSTFDNLVITVRLHRNFFRLLFEFGWNPIVINQIRNIFNFTEVDLLTTGFTASHWGFGWREFSIGKTVCESVHISCQPPNLVHFMSDRFVNPASIMTAVSLSALVVLLLNRLLRSLSGDRAFWHLMNDHPYIWRETSVFLLRISPRTFRNFRKRHYREILRDNREVVSKWLHFFQNDPSTRASDRRNSQPMRKFHGSFVPHPAASRKLSKSPRSDDAPGSPRSSTEVKSWSCLSDRKKSSLVENFLQWDSTQMWFLVSVIGDAMPRISITPSPSWAFCHYYRQRISRESSKTYTCDPECELWEKNSSVRLTIESSWIVM